MKEKNFNLKIKIRQENRCFDTWFSSALWPFATLGWPNKTKEDFETFMILQYF